MLTFILFLRPLNYKHLPHAQRVSHDFLSLLRYLLSSRSLLYLRACFSCHTFFPGAIEKNLGKRKKPISFFQRFERLSFAFFHRLVETSFALSALFPFFLLPFRMRCVVGTRRRGRGRHRRGCRRMLAGRGGGARSAVAVFMARRRVCLETQGKREWALFGLHLKN